MKTPLMIAVLTLGAATTACAPTTPGMAGTTGEARECFFVSEVRSFASSDDRRVYVETGASGPAQVGSPGTAGAGLLVQGALEGSNVNTVEELVSMIETQRAYETNAKAISTVDQMLGFLNQNL